MCDTNTFDHPFDLDEMNRDPTDEEIDTLSDHELAELFRDVARGTGSVDLYDRVSYRMVRRFDEYEADGRLSSKTDQQNDEAHFIVSGDDLSHISGSVENMIGEKIADILREDYGISFSTIEVEQGDDDE